MTRRTGDDMKTEIHVELNAAIYVVTEWDPEHPVGRAFEVPAGQLARWRAAIAEWELVQRELEDLYGVVLAQ